jgi:hypothetical protein
MSTLKQGELEGEVVLLGEEELATSNVFLCRVDLRN